MVVFNKGVVRLDRPASDFWTSCGPNGPAQDDPGNVIDLRQQMAQKHPRRRLAVCLLLGAMWYVVPKVANHHHGVHHCKTRGQRMADHCVQQLGH